ncbi:thiolase family protein [Streptomyces sp. NPDC058417]|uniref:thiolase family protein n=1 Tax=unclassified Streptomyces TaxID=2593676 RepID=UPI00365FAE37
MTQSATAHGDVHVVDTVRTPLGKFGGGLRAVRPDDLAATVLAALAERHPEAVAETDDVILGNANGAGEENRNVARMAVLLAGLPVRVPGATVNRLCASGLEAVVCGYRAIALGEADLVIAGGVESMTRAPFVLPKSDRPFPHAEQTLWSTSIGWRMVNPAHDPAHTLPMGEGAEILAELYGVDRARQDAYALDSHRKAAAAWADGRLAEEVVPGPWDLARDESVRPDSTAADLARLRPAFRAEGGTVTAGNSSPLNDGAAAVLLAGDRAVRRWGLPSLARITATGVSAGEPRLFGLGPVEATERALRRRGRSVDEVGVMEINEAFAAQVLACLGHWPGLDPDAVNPQGGAIALGHPLGCTGARLVGTLARQLDRGGASLGVASACIGVGQGLAVVLER